MEKSALATPVAKFANIVDISELHPSVHNQMLNALHAIERLEAAFGWVLTLFALGPRRSALPR